MAMPKFKTVEEYFASIPPHAVELAMDLRSTILSAAPKSNEVLSYNMPAYKQNGVLVYWCVFKNHIGFFPTSSPIQVFAAELAGFKTSKGTIQLPIDRPIPKGLIKKIVKYRLAEDAEKACAKAAKKK